MKVYEEGAPPRGGGVASRLRKTWQEVKWVVLPAALAPKPSLSVVHPQGAFLQNWNFLMLLLVVLNGMRVPYNVVFATRHSVSFGPFYFLDSFMDLLFLIDIFVHFRTAFMEEGILVTDRSVLARKYVRGYFLLDLLASLPLDLLCLLPDTSLQCRPATRSLRLLRCVRIPDYFDRWERDIRLNPVSIRIAKFLLMVALTVHWFGCCWWAIGESDGTGDNWVRTVRLLPGTDLESSQRRSQYIASLYWVIMTVTTVGFGNIVATTTEESAFAIGVMLVGFAMYGFILGNVASLIQSLDVSATAFRNKLESIETYMIQRELGPELRAKIRSYYLYLWSTHQGVDESELLEELPSSLRSEVALFLNREVIQKVPLFEGCDNNLISALVLRMKPQIYSPGDLVVRKDEIGHEMYFISRGTVEVGSEGFAEVFATLGPGSFFGEMALLLDAKRTASVRTCTYCDIYMLTKSDFDNVLQDNVEFAARIREIAKERKKQLELAK